MHLLQLYLLVSFGFSLEIHVSPNGDDVTGTGSFSLPYRSIRRATAILNSLCKIPERCEQGAILNVYGGEEYIDSPIVLSDLTASSGFRIEIRGSNENEPVELSGAVPLVTSIPNPSDPILAHFSSTVRSSILVADLPISWSPNSGSELLWRKKPQVEARWPDDPVALAWATGDTSLGAQQGGGCVEEHRGVSTIDEPFLCAGFARSSPLENWTWDHITASPSAPFHTWSWEGWKVKGLFTYDWAGAESTVKEFSSDNRSITFTEDSWNSQGYWGGCKYIAFGAPEALSSPGEYFIDLTSRRVYWLPPQNISIGSHDLSITISTSLLVISNSSRVTISNIIFWGCTGACIIIENSTEVIFDQNVVQSAGGRAIDAHSLLNANVSISNNYIAHTGDDSVWILGGDVNTLTRSGVVASHNLILNFGRLSFAFNPGIGVDGVGSIAENNLIIGGPACGLMFGGALQQISKNIIADSLRQTFDMGVVCTGPRDWTQAAVNLSFNALIRNGYTPLLANHVSDPLRNGFYLDYGNFGHTIYGNVVWQPSHPSTPSTDTVLRSLPTLSFAAYNHGGRNFIVENSIIVDINGVEANGGGLEGGDKAQLQNGSHYYTSLMQCGGDAGWREPPCSTLLPGLQFLDDFVSSNCSFTPSCAPAPYNNSVTQNIALTRNLNGTFFQGPSEQNIPVTLASNLVDIDPRFSAGSAFRDEMDFSLSPDSPAWALGFQNLNMDLWGPQWINPPGAWRHLLRSLVPWAVCPQGSETGCLDSSNQFYNASFWDGADWMKLLQGQGVMEKKN
jgi:hypothetical protein